MNYRKQTAWKKSRKFGDVSGGRTSAKITDKIFNRAHSLSRPAPGQATPIFIIDNPSRDFLFPITRDDILAALKRLPHTHVAGITHIWLRRVKKSEFERGATPFAEFICGSGVRLIVLYPWPKNLALDMGRSRPSPSQIRVFEKYCAKMALENGRWIAYWTLESLREFYIEHLLLHEIGHHVDRYDRRWSKANFKQVEEFANQYAVEWSAKATRIHNVETGNDKFFLSSSGSK